MSARTVLLAALDAALPAADFRVSTRTSAPDQIDVGLLWVMAFTTKVEPGPTLGLLTYSLDLWVLTGAQDPSTADDKLDDKLDDVLSALLDIRSVQFLSADRGVTADEQYHGYKFTLHAYGKSEN